MSEDTQPETEPIIVKVGVPVPDSKVYGLTRFTKLFIGISTVVVVGCTVFAITFLALGWSGANATIKDKMTELTFRDSQITQLETYYDSLSNSNPKDDKKNPLPNGLSCPTGMTFEHFSITTSKDGTQSFYACH